jgi:hypothetical protein
VHRCAVHRFGPAARLGAAFAVAGKALGATLAYLSRGADGDQELFASYDPLMT